MSRTLNNWLAPAQAPRRRRLMLVGMWAPVLVGAWFFLSDTIGVPPPRLTRLISLVFVCASFSVVMAWACMEIRLAFGLRRLLRRGRAICFECGYRVDNVGATSECCPECGYSIEQSKVRTEEWVEKNLRFCFWPFTLLEPRKDKDEEDPA